MFSLDSYCKQMLYFRMSLEEGVLFFMWNKTSKHKKVRNGGVSYAVFDADSSSFLLIEITIEQDFIGTLTFEGQSK